MEWSKQSLLWFYLFYRNSPSYKIDLQKTNHCMCKCVAQITFSNCYSSCFVNSGGKNSRLALHIRFGGCRSSVFLPWGQELNSVKTLHSNSAMFPLLGLSDILISLFLFKKKEKKVTVFPVAGKACFFYSVCYHKWFIVYRMATFV